MFTPDQAEVRRFFCGAWRKRGEGLPVTPLELLAADWMARHPEYHQVLGDEAAAVAFQYSPDSGHENPFLHLSLHLSIQEQVSIDHPRGIRAAWQALLARTGSDHEAAHALIECLAEAIWRSQRGNLPIDELAYRRAIAETAGLAQPEADVSPDPRPDNRPDYRPR